MPLPFIHSRRKKRVVALPPRVSLPPDTLEFEEASLRVQYHSISSHGVRLPHTDDVPTLLPRLLEGFATEVELIEPLSAEFQDAAPQLLRPQTALQWINAHHGRSRIGRHALYILESLDVIDLAYETFAVALLATRDTLAQRHAAPASRHVQHRARPRAVAVPGAARSAAVPRLDRAGSAGTSTSRAAGRRGSARR